MLLLIINKESNLQTRYIGFSIYVFEYDDQYASVYLETPRYKIANEGEVQC